MRKVFSMFFLSIIMILTGCGSNEEQVESSSEILDTIATITKYSEGDSVQRVVLRMGITSGDTSNEYIATQYLAKLLEEKSNGEIKLEVVPDAKLGNDIAMLEMCSSGKLDMTFGETGRLGLWVKEAEIFQLPYMFDEFSSIREVLFETVEGQRLLKKFYDKKNWVVVDTAYNGTRQVTSNFPINSPSDMKDMKLRVPNAQANLEFATNVGAQAVPMNFSDVYLALETGIVDGQENPLSTINSSKFNEVQTHIALTNHILNDQAYIVSKSTFNILSTEHQNILEEAISETAEFHTSLFVEDEKVLIDYFKEQGVTITEPDNYEFKELMKNSYDRYLRENGVVGKELYQVINSKK